MIALKHVVRITSSSMLGALVLLTFLRIAFNLLGELSELTAHYTLLDALAKTLWKTPEILATLVPLSVLMGAVIGLGAMSASNELIVLRAAGISIYRIVGWVLIPTLCFGFFYIVLVEWITPFAATKIHALHTKKDAVHTLQENDNPMPSAIWLKRGNSFLYIGQAQLSASSAKNIETTPLLTGIKLFSINPQGELSSYQHAEHASPLPPTTLDKTNTSPDWLLHHVKKINLTTHAAAHQVDIQRSSQPTQPATLHLPQWQIQLLATQPDDIALSHLYRFNQSMQKFHDIPKYNWLIFWKKATMPVLMIALVLLASAFSFGSIRQMSVGVRIVIALVFGFTLNYVQEFLGYASLLSTLSSLWFVMIPCIVCTLGGLYLIKKAG